MKAQWFYGGQGELALAHVFHEGCSHTREGPARSRLRGLWEGNRGRRRKIVMVVDSLSFDFGTTEQ